ncbi:hypothetical protein QMS86_13980 [Cronobacter dublinensis]|uniref:hypothetical protein n=1 Tax=Cronobacter dublinensis TaxID=413497 RepID=UPI003AD91C6C
MSEFTTANLQFIEDYDRVEPGEASALARELLALRERAEPIYQERLFHVSGKKQIEYWAEINKGAYQYLPESERRIVYAAPPAPVVPDETFDEWSRRCEIQLTLCRPEFREVAEITWKACRDAMLAAPGKN